MKPIRSVSVIRYRIDVETAPNSFDSTVLIYDPLEAMKTYQEMIEFYEKQDKKVYITEITEIAETRTLSPRQLKKISEKARESKSPLGPV